MHAIITVWVTENNEMYREMEKTIQRFHCTIVKMEISISYHVIVNSQLNRDHLKMFYIIYYICVQRCITIFITYHYLLFSYLTAFYS